MKLPIKEPTAPKYLYINPKTNTVHLLMPIMSGTEIGLDNTCKSVYSLQEFFGLAGADKERSALGVLTDYKAVLEFDLKYMPASAAKTAKAHRLSQIDTYLDILNQVQLDTRIRNPLMRNSPVYPEPLVHLMQSVDANLHSIILRPRVQDSYLRTTAIEPTFSANHNQMVNDEIVPEASLFDTLRNRYQTIPLTPKSTEGLIALIRSKRVGLPVDFDQIKVQLKDEIKTYLGIDVRFEQTHSNQAQRAAGAIVSAPMNQPYLDEQLGINADNPATIEDYVNGLIHYCTPNLFDNVEDSPFYTVNDPEQLSILTQFFLAHLNIACQEASITTADFGQVLESDATLVEALAEAVKEALAHSASVEETLISFINQHQNRFGLTTLISEESLPALKGSPTLNERFKSHWEEIKESPHFDEFMLLAKKSGLFVTHQYGMAIHFANFLQMGWQDNRLDMQLQDFHAVDKPDNVIPHKNEHIHADMAEIEIDLSHMDKDALQALYEDISNYPDQTLSKELLAQFKLERPDFKPRIDAKQFLQHVAYGEQDEAEALLQQDPELAQELLQADGIPFTDYSGRTFKCTAYEYAYWAKDSHMQRMLEKYIRINEETRQLILQRVEDIEKLVSSSGPGFFQSPPKPQGLHYTTKNKQGSVIEHQDAGFDLTPLINALNHYVAEHDKKPNKTEADWDALEKIWIEEVGRAQRDIPAHIAHEYCHPDRSFEDVNENNQLLDASNPDNLKRQLKFYNYDTGNTDVWFSPNSYSVDSGLGFSFGVCGAVRLRRGTIARGLALGLAGLQLNVEWRGCDSAALTTIDKVRTIDREQSRLFLSHPLNLQESQSHGL
jgi:hypothetical protein